MSSLSRHFYEIDEVHAALQYTTNRNDCIETVFWCHELLRSGYVEETISTLFESWLWNKGPFCLSWLLHASALSNEELSEEDILLSVYQLSIVPYTRRDNSVWRILVLTAMDAPPDRVTPNTPPELPSTNEKEIYMMRALYQGKAYSAWWISRHLETERVWELLRWYAVRHGRPSLLSCFDLLEKYETLLGYRSDEYDVIIRCVAVLSTCLSPSQQEMSWKALPNTLDMRIQQAVTEWDNELGRKSHRRYAIPTCCLYGKTRRGTMRWAQSTVQQLGELEEGLKRCNFWIEAMEPYQTDNRWISDDTRDAFYDTYFPDDIPDEWTKPEKQKSHGDGILGPKDTITLSKYSRCFLDSCARFAWCTPAIQTFLEQKQGTTLDVIHWFPPVKPIDSSQLRPVHRKVCL